MSEHIPLRPSWECAACGKDWPCDAAREQLAIDTGGGTPLRMLAWSYLDDFTRDVPVVFADGTYERFLGWT